MKWYHWLILAAAIFCAGLGVGLWLGSLKNANKPPQAREVVRTEVVTQWHEHPAPIAVKTAKTGKRDTVYILRDSIIFVPAKPDTVAVALEREQKYYEDSTYRAWVSGYKPRLDSIDVAERLKTVTVAETRYRGDVVEFGPAATYGYDPVRRQGAFVVGGGVFINLKALWNNIFDK